MKKLIMIPVLLLMSLTANAGQFADLYHTVMVARDSLVTLVKHPEKRGADQQKLVKDTADAVSAMIKTMSAPAGREAEFNEMVKNWEAFKKTREEELVPLILAGRQAEGKAIAMGIQKTRLKKVLSLCKALDQ